MIIMIEHSTVMSILSQYLGQDILSVRFESGRKTPKLTVYAEVPDPATKVVPMAQLASGSVADAFRMSDDTSIEGELEFHEEEDEEVLFHEHLQQMKEAQREENQVGAAETDEIFE